MSFTVAIVGRPNVGKSTLFNRLVGKRLALVDDQPGVTRDLREGEGRLGDLRFTVIDTAGLEEADERSLTGRMRKLTERGVEMADICLFVIDARAGIVGADHTFAEILRKKAQHVILLANKAEGRAGHAGLYESYALGLGDPVPISAEHNQGMDILYDALRPLADCFAEQAAHIASAAPDIETETDDPELEIDADTSIAALKERASPLQIAVIGRPNAGKSTLVNRIIGDERLLTGPEAGITRDAIGLEAEWEGLPVRIFDTAGMRKRAKVQDKIEKLSVSDGFRAIKFAEVVVLMIDALQPFETQDLKIADLVAREGRALVIAVNKWDLVEEKQKALNDLREKCARLLPQIRGVEMVCMSAQTGRNLERLHQVIIRAYGIWNMRISTGRLNRWLTGMIERHPPPAPSGRRIKIRFMTQPKTRPPTFAVFSSRADALPAAYSRYLVNGLREDFGLAGTPIRLFMRKGENPYD